MWHRYNNNPCGKNIGDCSVRAVSVALGTDWYEAYDILCEEGRRSCDMPSGDAVWGNVLRSAGFRRLVIPNTCPDCYTAEDFAREHPGGIYTLAFGGHVATLRDGVIYDSWDSSQESPIFYYWRR